MVVMSDLPRGLDPEYHWLSILHTKNSPRTLSQHHFFFRLYFRKLMAAANPCMPVHVSVIGIPSPRALGNIGIMGERASCTGFAIFPHM
jgi:hypothetical protein